MNVQVSLGKHLLQLDALLLPLSKQTHIGGLHVTVLQSRIVKSGITEAAGAAQLLAWHAHPGLPEDSNELFVGKSASFRTPHFPQS